MVALFSVLLAMAGGIIIGTTCGYLGGVVDAALMRVMDLMLSFPYLLLAIILAAVLRERLPSLVNTTMAIGIWALPTFARMVRASVLTIKKQEYITSARAVGAPGIMIVWSHIIPNFISPVVVYASLFMANAIMMEAALSFLGLGVQPPTPSWGEMISAGRNFLMVAPHVATIPGLAIMVAVLGFNLLGDGLRDALDPQDEDPIGQAERHNHESTPAASKKPAHLPSTPTTESSRPWGAWIFPSTAAKPWAWWENRAAEKASTSLSIMGLIPDPPGFMPEGEILFEGRDLLKLGESQMQKVRGNEISMIFQEPMTSLNPVHRVGKQIGEALHLHLGFSASQAKERVLKLLAQVGIPDPEQRYGEYPFQMSGGMRQRVVIAMALACQPKLIIADEPTTALDVTIQAQILALMARLQKKLGSSILMITHDLGVIAETVSRVAVMYAGKIVEQAGTKAIFADPQAPIHYRAHELHPGNGAPGAGGQETKRNPRNRAQPAGSAQRLQFSGPLRQSHGPMPRPGTRTHHGRRRPSGQMLVVCLIKNCSKSRD